MDFTLKVGDTYQLKTTVGASPPNQGITYSTPAWMEAIAFVEASGVVTARTPGIILITASDANGNPIKTYTGLVPDPLSPAASVAPSVQVSAAQIVAPGPANFRALFGSAGSVVFAWTPAAGAASYRLYNADTGAVVANIPAAQATVTLSNQPGSYGLVWLDGSGNESQPVFTRV